MRRLQLHRLHGCLQNARTKVMLWLSFLGVCDDFLCYFVDASTEGLYAWQAKQSSCLGRTSATLDNLFCITITIFSITRQWHAWSLLKNLVKLHPQSVCCDLIYFSGKSFFQWSLRLDRSLSIRFIAAVHCLLMWLAPMKLYIHLVYAKDGCMVCF